MGTPVTLWNKLIKEVKLKRVAGPFDSVPFKYFIQSPIGLVTKTGGQTRLIFHLSFEFGPDEKSVNYHTSVEKCSVKYQDLDEAIRNCCRVKEFKMGHMSLYWCEDDKGNEYIYLGCSDIKSAFRLLPLNRSSWRWLVMKCKNPITGEIQYFVDKCLPFGSSMSCSHFQWFSDALKFLIQFRTAADTINNYLDNFLFVAATLLLCNYLINEFLAMCEELGVPIAFDKTEWASLQVIFLRILLDGQNMLMIVPEEKRIRAVEMIQLLLNKKKAQVKDLQSLCGFLNFLNRAVIPGRAFTRRMYAKFSRVADFSKVGIKTKEKSKTKPTQEKHA